MSAVITKVAELVADELVRKDFSTGSRGFHATGKVAVDGTRYQVSGMAVLIGSKQDPELEIDANRDEAATALRRFAEGELVTKTFASGKTGYHAQGKVAIAGQRYQVSAQAVALA